MNITCPSCKSRYTVDDARVPASGVTIKCPNCQHKFVARAPGGTKPPGAVALPGRAPATPPDAAPPGPKSSGAVALPGTSGTGRSEPFQAPSRAVPLPGSGPRAPSQDVPQTDAGSLDLGFDGSGELEMPSTGSLDFIDDASGKAQAEPLFTTPELRVRHRNGRVEGPYGLERIKALLKAGELSGNEDVSSDGLSWRAMTAHPELNGFLNTLAGAQDALAFGQVDLDPGGSIDISAPSAPSMPTPGELDLGLDPEPSSPSPGTGPLFTPPPPVDAGPPGPSAVDELRQSLDLDVPPVAPAGSSALEAGGLTPPVPRDLLEVGEIPDMPPFWETYRRPIIAFLSVAALFLVGVVTHFMTPYGAFGIPRLVETLTYEPPPPPPPAPPPAPPKLVNREEIQTLLDEHGYESFRSATLTLEKAGTALPVNALAIAKTRVLATLAYGPEAFPLGPAQTAVAQLGSLDPESVEGVTPERIRQERLKAQAGLAILEAETEGVIDPLTKASEARPDDPELAYLLGKAHEVAGRPSEALVYFDRALVARPDYSQASRNIGRLLEAEGAENEAAIWFEKAWSANPSDARSALDAARLHKKSGRPGLEREAIVAAARGAPRGLPPDERAAALLSAVRSLDDSGQLSKAADLASEAARLAPADARAVGFLAVAKSLEGDHTGALALLEPVLQRNPEELAALVARARVHMKAGDVAKALLDLESARPLDEGPEVLMWLARCNRQIGKISDAEAALKLASERPGSTAAKVELSRLALAVGNVEEAFSEAEAAVKADPKSLPARVQLGRALAGRGELEQAEQVFEKALGLDEDSNEARLGLGNALREQAERSERPRRSKALGRATALYLQVLNDNPDDAAVLYEYGRVLELQSNLRGAIRLYERAASLDERDVRPHLMMVSAHLRTQNPKAARASLEKAEEIDLASGNQSGEVRFWAARLALVDGDAAKAVAAMKQAVELAPENAEYWLWLGRGLERNNSLFEAIAAYEKAVRLNSRLAPAHRALGRAAIERHRYPEAREHLERFRRFAPDDASVWSDIGETFSGENRDREALDAFEKALNADPEALRALIEAGKIHSRQGKDKVAQASFRKATRSHPRSGEAWCLLGLSLAQRKVSREARQALQKCRDGDGPGDLVDSANELLDAR